MNILELMHALEDAYDRFGDIKVAIEVAHESSGYCRPYELMVDADEFTIMCE